MATSQIELPIFASTENESIANNLESFDGKKDPERQRDMVNKYTRYAASGLGTFNPAMGSGVYGVEFQKDSRRQAGGLQRSLWGLEIRAPLRNRITAGMALV